MNQIQGGGSREERPAMPVRGPLRILPGLVRMGILLLALGGFESVVKRVTSGSLTLAGRPAVRCGFSGATFSFRTEVPCLARVEWWEDEPPRARFRTRVIGDLQSRHTLEVAGLVPDTRYRARVLLSLVPGSDFDLPSSEELEFSTLPSLAPFDVGIQSTDTTVVITWETPGPADSVVRYGCTRDAWEWQVTTLHPRRDTSHQVVIGGLAAGSSYTFQIVASDPDLPGEILAAEPRTFQTYGEPAKAPEAAAIAVTGCCHGPVPPEMRDRFRAAFFKGCSHTRTLTRERMEEILAVPTDPGREDEFNTRLQEYRTWVVTARRKGIDVDSLARKDQELQKCYYINRRAAGRRLDEAFRVLAGRTGMIQVRCPGP